MGHETETKGKGRPRTGKSGPEELQYERYVMIGGYENPDQSLPSGEGNFYFETNDPGRIDSFYAPDADRLLRHICHELGPVDIVRMHGYTWSVEDSENIYGTISEIGGRKPSLFGCLDTSKENPPERETANCRTEIIVVYQVTEASP